MRVLVPLLSLLLSALSHTAPSNAREAPTRTPIAFELHDEYTPRLEDGELHELSQVAFDVSNASQRASSTMILQATPTTVYRPRDAAAFQHARLRSLRSQESEAIEWEEVRVLAPDVEDKHTLSQLARMTGNAYALPGRPNWYEIDPAWNTVRTLFLCPAFPHPGVESCRAKADVAHGVGAELPIRLGR